MKLQEQLSERLANPDLTSSERARLRCQFAKELEQSGDYKGACEAMGELWRGAGERPALSILDEETAAEVLLRAGAITGWLASINQIADAQEKAKDLISESINVFEALRRTEKVCECRAEIAVCYWRQGALDDARIILQEVLERLGDANAELRAIALLRLAMVEKVATRLHDALRLHMEAAPLFEASTNHTLKGKFHGEFGTVLKNLGAAEHREDYVDRAFVEHEAASFHFEKAGHKVYCACVENNLAMLFLTVGKYDEAHKHLNRAQRMLTDLKDSVHLAQANETRAKVLLAEGRNSEAETVVRLAVQTLQRGGEQSLLAEALTTLGTALARMGKHARARQTLENAVNVAEQSGDLAAAGRAALTIVEELSEQSTPGELCSYYEQAAERLINSQQPNIPTRLIAGARLIIRLFKTTQIEPESIPTDWQGFSFRKAIHRYERLLIERALKDANGVVTRAAQLLGFKHHHSLIAMLKNRHRALLSARSPVVTRKSSIMRGSSTRTRQATDKQSQPITILHVEDNEEVANTVRDTLESNDWRVEACADGVTALRRLASDTHYDLLLFDNELPGLDGLELVRTARKLPHRRRTPIVMFSASDVEADAWKAGVDAFLKKPEDVAEITSMISRLLMSKGKC